jgi:acetolactate synthase-1/2/3 large subunit
MKDSKPRTGLDRRSFLKATAGAGLIAPGLSHAQEDSNRPEAKPVAPGFEQEAAEHGSNADYTEEQRSRYFVDDPGSDFMVDVIKRLDMDYMALNPGSSFRGLQESVVNYGGNSKPEFITANHEGICVSMAHGYFKASGKMMGALVHGSVGIQHTPMALYSAWCDRVPMIVIVGNHNDVAERTGPLAWVHSAQDLPKLVRDFTKWDDTCHSLGHFAQSMIRAHKIAMTPPMGPVVIAIDAEDQERSIVGERPIIPEVTETIAPQADRNALDEIATWLVDAEQPVFVAERMAHDQGGINSLVELAEVLQAGVVDNRSRVNFPTEHHLFQDRAVLSSADVVVALEVNGPVASNIKAEAKVATIGMGDQNIKANFQNFGAYYAPDLAVVGDAQSSLPYLTEAVKLRLKSSKKSRLEARGKRWQETYMKARDASLSAATRGWDRSPITTARMYMETYEVIKDRDWSLVALDKFQSSWGKRIWPINQYHQYHGSSGSAGIGYGAPAAVGAALAHRDAGRTPVNFQKDGDLMFYPGALWTAAHHNIPLLSIMHNNRAYHAETMIVQRIANQRRRGVVGSSRIGTVMDDPPIDFGGLAKSLGVWSTKTITEPNDLAPALKKALEVVDAGEPALLDVYCPGR